MENEKQEIPLMYPIYLVVCDGYEGIQKILGAYGKNGAIKRVKELRKKPLDKYTKPEQYCVMLLEENDCRCVCGELGVGLKQVWLMG